jgi:hypothetical protein
MGAVRKRAGLQEQSPIDLARRILQFRDEVI